MELAVVHTINRHPLFRSLVIKNDGPAHWNVLPSAATRVHWVNQDANDDWLTDSSLDLSTQTGFIVMGRQYTGTDQVSYCDLVIKVHHACADGLGTLTAVHELLLIYDILQRDIEADIDSQVGLPQLDFASFSRRNQFGLSPLKILRLIPKQMVGLHGVRQFLMRRPIPLIPHSPVCSDEAQALSVAAEARTFSPAETRRLRQVAQSLKVALNELLASSIFESLDKFRTNRGVRGESDWLRMMIPVSMRSSVADQLQPACNIVSSIFLDRKPPQIRETAELLKSIHEEMELIKKNRLALMFSLSVWLRSKLARGRIPKTTNRCQTTVVFTNLGKLFSRSPLLDAARRIVAGGLILERAEPLAPLNPYMCVAFTASIYAEQLQLLVRYDNRLLNKDDADCLLQEAFSSLKAHMRESANGDLKTINTRLARTTP